jgi:hypothetical protein
VVFVLGTFKPLKLLLQIRNGFRLVLELFLNNFKALLRLMILKNMMPLELAKAIRTFKHLIRAVQFDMLNQLLLVEFFGAGAAE